jgi:hypothetical protein
MVDAQVNAQLVQLQLMEPVNALVEPSKVDNVLLLVQLDGLILMELVSNVIATVANVQEKLQLAHHVKLVIY